MSGANGDTQMPPPRLWVFVFLLLCLAGTGWLCLDTARGQEAGIAEYKVKAAFLFNFAKFVEWPAQSFATAETPLIIGIFGENPFGRDLEEIVHNKTINNHYIEVRELHSLAACTNCHVLFISAVEKSRTAEILASMHDSSVLTVGESAGFTEAGGMINFVLEGKKIRFQINDEAAKKARLKISSKLLGLAVQAGH